MSNNEQEGADRGGVGRRVSYACQAAFLYAVHWLRLDRVRVVERIVHWLGWRRFVQDDFSRPHAEGCAGPNVETLLRVGGSVRRCVACGETVGIKLACWETDDGYMPADVVQWLTKELLRGAKEDVDHAHGPSIHGQAAAGDA